MISNIFAAGVALLSVAVVNSLLSVDDALVLAVMVEHLPSGQRTKALRYGIVGAYAMRGASIFAASMLISFWQLKLLGGAYLLGLAVSHLFPKSEASGAAKKRNTYADCGRQSRWSNGSISLSRSTTFWPRSRCRAKPGLSLPASAFQLLQCGFWQA